MLPLVDGQTLWVLGVRPPGAAGEVGTRRVGGGGKITRDAMLSSHVYQRQLERANAEPIFSLS